MWISGEFVVSVYQPNFLRTLQCSSWIQSGSWWMVGGAVLSQCSTSKQILCSHTVCTKLLDGFCAANIITYKCTQHVEQYMGAPTPGMQTQIHSNSCGR